MEQSCGMWKRDLGRVRIWDTGKNWYSTDPSTVEIGENTLRILPSFWHQWRLSASTGGKTCSAAVAATTTTIIIIIIIIIIQWFWIVDYLKMYKISDKVTKLILEAMKNWEVKLIAGGKTFAEVKIQRGIFNIDAVFISICYRNDPIQLHT